MPLSNLRPIGPFPGTPRSASPSQWNTEMMGDWDRVRPEPKTSSRTQAAGAVLQEKGRIEGRARARKQAKVGCPACTKPRKPSQDDAACVDWDGGGVCPGPGTGARVARLARCLRARIVDAVQARRQHGARHVGFGVVGGHRDGGCRRSTGGEWCLSE
ncbi:hypothetical protein BCR44DRAFT_1119796 [Catenaria anguillulae PL171]|uniref:Uncharacterized protein n=1 Tax=Catenaria anguillulae PL171 TaxID=765915 RepID=A0A1Y2HLH8_9FUNG|nr:hypothetical protein BCR44DRAFT_1119796 [Catenaria anguillulae PL171]